MVVGNFMVDLTGGENYILGVDGKETYVKPQFSPDGKYLTYIKRIDNKDTFVIVDLATRQPAELKLPAGYKLRTDSTGTYTVVFEKDENMFVYHHPSGQRYRNLPGGTPVDNVRTVYQIGEKGKWTHQAMMIDADTNKIYALEENGDLREAGRREFDDFLVEEAVFGDGMVLLNVPILMSITSPRPKYSSIPVPFSPSTPTEWASSTYVYAL